MLERSKFANVNEVQTTELLIATEQYVPSPFLDSSRFQYLYCSKDGSHAFFCTADEVVYARRTWFDVKLFWLLPSLRGSTAAAADVRYTALPDSVEALVASERVVLRRIVAETEAMVVGTSFGCAKKSKKRVNCAWRQQKSH